MGGIPKEPLHGVDPVAIEVDIEAGTSENLKATIAWQQNLLNVLGNTQVLSGSRLPFFVDVGVMPAGAAELTIPQPSFSLDPFAELLTEKIGIPVETFVSTDYTGLVERIGTNRWILVCSALRL
ncbi:MAG: hypothetical protein SNJ85_08785 [Cyanobacteriota bacterium]